MDNAYQWVPFYEAIADKLLAFNDKRADLFNLMKKVASEQPLMKYLHFEREDWWDPNHHQIDPFSVIGVFNRGITDVNRTFLAKVLANTFEVKVIAPTLFAGIPVLDNRKSFFAGADEIWDLFVIAMKSAETNTFTAEFSMAFEKALAVNGNGLAYITMGLYWIRPNAFMPLDGNSRSFVAARYGITAPNSGCTGDDYINFLGAIKNELSKHSPVISFPAVSHNAWIERGTAIHPETEASSADTPGTSNNNKILKNGLSEKNIILYGSPGTGKTYSSIQYAVAIVEEKPIADIKTENYSAVFSRYLKYKEAGLVAFTTFHQSFGYEEFIEGIRPVVFSEEKTDSGQEIEYEVHDGIFKSFCDKAGTPIGSEASVDLGIGKNPTVWKVSLEGTGDNLTRTECMENNHIRIGWGIYGETISDATDFSKDGGNIVLNAFYNRMQIGDIIMSCYSSKTIDAIGVVTGEPEWHSEYP